MSNFADYAERLQNADHTAFLGDLCWYTVPEHTKIKYGILKAAATKVALEDFLPPPPLASDVFKRVCTMANRKRVETADPDVFVNVLLRNVKTLNRKVWKQIVIERVDGENKTLDYVSAYEVHFDGHQIHFTKMDDDPTGAADEATVLISSEFKAWVGHVNAYGVREFFRRSLLGARATVVRPSGGIYFVLRMHADTVAGLDRLANEIPLTFHYLPLLDDSKQREMLQKAFEAETADEIDTMLGQVEKMLEGKPVTSEIAEDWIAKMVNVRDKTQDYEQILDEKLGNTEFRLQQFERATKALLNHVAI